MEIHFSELFLIIIVALVVIKPNRLPEIAFQFGKCLQWLRHSLFQLQKHLKHEE